MLNLKTLTKSAVFLVAGYFFYINDLMVVFFLVSIIAGIFMCLDTKERKGLSAYSVFNKNFESLPGTFSN